MKFLENLINLENKIVEKIVNSHTYLKILSLFLAVILFFIVNGTGISQIDKLFEETRYVDDVELNVISDNDKIVLGLPKSIGVNVSGTKDQINSFESNKNSLSASINLTNREDGKYEISSDELTFSNVNSKLKIDPVVKNYNVNIDTKVKETYPVEVNYVGVDKNESIILKKPQLSSPNVSFEIGMNQTKDIGSVMVILNLEELDPSKEDGQHIYNNQIKIYDKEGKVIDTHAPLPTIKVIQEYENKTITLPVRYNILNNDTGKYVAQACKDKISDNCIDEVEVYGDQEKINSLQYVDYNLDLADFNEKKPYVKATPSIESGIYIKGNSDFNVNISLEKGETKVIKGVPIAVQNLNPLLKASPIDTPVVDITITGAKGNIDKLNKDSILVYVDAKDISNANVYKLPIETNVSNLFDYKLSQNEIEVNLVESK